MAVYKAPVRDMKFVLHDLFESDRRFAELGYDEATPDLVDAILDEGAKFCENVIFPTNRPGDRQGARHEHGRVRTPDGFREAYQALTEGGWMALAADPADGGQGLPGALAMCFEEMLQSSNMAFALYPGLTRGACVALHAHGSERLRRDYLPRMVSGEWTGVMCLTEPHCGTDLGLLRTRAEARDDGTYAVRGTKIFITGGEHDLTENTVHLVLARLADAPPGVKGISMFVVPKRLLRDDGSLGDGNGVQCASIEHKMGIRGSATCVMNYEDAVGYLVGEPNRGLACMFSMMNHERLLVGQQGLAQAEVAYQSAVAYARERVQGRALNPARRTGKAADPIIVHPDVRRMLLTARANNEAARALLVWAALLVDSAERHPDAAERERAADLTALLTPVIKAHVTDYGFDACNLCLQVFGGHGYIAEWGMEQLVRDARIAQIYEGANGIHALDLVGRKLPMHDGRLMRRYLETLDAFCDESASDAALSEFSVPLKAAAGRLRDATAWVNAAVARDPDETGACSYDYLRLVALTAFAYMWARSAKVALAKLEGDNSGFYRDKLTLARFYMKRLLPHTRSLTDTLAAGADTLMELEAEAF